MRVQLVMHVPVYVTVDLDEGTIDRVRINDQVDAEWRRDETWDADTCQPVSDEAHAAAVAIADDSEWPSWDWI